MHSLPLIAFLKGGSGADVPAGKTSNQKYHKKSSAGFIPKVSIFYYNIFDIIYLSEEK